MRSGTLFQTNLKNKSTRLCFHQSITVIIINTIAAITLCKINTAVTVAKDAANAAGDPLLVMEIVANHTTAKIAPNKLEKANCLETEQFQLSIIALTVLTFFQ